MYIGKPCRQRCIQRSHQRGVALIVILLLLVAMVILGLLNSSNALMQTRMARSEREYQNAFAAAESALADGEREIMEAIRRATIGAQSEVVTSAFIGPAYTSLAGSCDSSGVLTASTSGLYNMALCPSAWWLQFSFVGANSNLLGSITGASLPVASTSYLVGVSSAPRYIIDILPDNTAGQSASPNKSRQLFRVTARGVGSSTDTEVLLQSVIRRLD